MTPQRRGPRPDVSRHRRWPRLAVAALLATVLAGCASILGGESDPTTIYSPDPRPVLDPALPTVSWQLALGSTSGARTVDSYRIAVRPTPGEIQVYRGASWARTPGEMLQSTVLRALEDSGKIASVARQGTGVAADYRLVIDLRRFEADYAGNAVPAATIEFNAKLIHGVDQAIVASRTFLQTQPATGTDVPQVVAAFDRALGNVSGELAAWVLVSGDEHQRQAHPRITR
ncbi:MAG: membrane integrity-associated transporter subunit PqiC [Luteimonas sp.]|nr:membrane integrity-associated transporter subunit PqiC [Luteimonas sp.]